MQLIGQYDSGFVRRVGITLRHYGYPFTHHPHSVFRDAEHIAEHNPLLRVPTLVLDDGTVLVDSSVCIEVLDGRFAAAHGEDHPALLLPRSGLQREAGLRACGFACGLLDKAVTLVYERLQHPVAAPQWQARCEHQLLATLSLLEQERQQQSTAFWLGAALSHADIAITCALTFVANAHPQLLSRAPSLTALRDLSGRCEALPNFAAVYQPFVVHV